MNSDMEYKTPEEPAIDRDLMRVAYHEAGHAVTAHYLGQSFRSVTIKPDAKETYLGRVLLYSPTKWFLEAMEVDAGSLMETNNRLRNRVEVLIITALAGGLAAEMMTGVAREEDTGVVERDPEEREALARRFGGTPEYWAKAIIRGSDSAIIDDLATRMSGGDAVEGEAYVQWLTARARRLMGHPRFRVAIEAVAKALLEKVTLSRKRVRQIIHDAVEAHLRGLLAKPTQSSRPT